MALARVICRSNIAAAPLIERLRALGYTVETTAPGDAPAEPADVEIELESYSLEEAIGQAESFGRDHANAQILIAPGVLPPGWNFAPQSRASWLGRAWAAIKGRRHSPEPEYEFSAAATQAPVRFNELQPNPPAAAPAPVEITTDLDRARQEALLRRQAEEHAREEELLRQAAEQHERERQQMAREAEIARRNREAQALAMRMAEEAERLSVLASAQAQVQPEERATPISAQPVAREDQVPQEERGLPEITAPPQPEQDLVFPWMEAPPVQQVSSNMAQVPEPVRELSPAQVVPMPATRAPEQKRGVSLKSMPRKIAQAGPRAASQSMRRLRLPLLAGAGLAVLLMGAWSLATSPKPASPLSGEQIQKSSGMQQEVPFGPVTIRSQPTRAVQPPVAAVHPIPVSTTAARPTTRKPRAVVNTRPTTKRRAKRPSPHRYATDDDVIVRRFTPARQQEPAQARARTKHISDMD